MLGQRTGAGSIIESADVTQDGGWVVGAGHQVCFLCSKCQVMLEEQRGGKMCVQAVQQRQGRSPAGTSETVSAAGAVKRSACEQMCD